MKKSLVPLIISMSFIVVLTAIIINTKPEMRQSPAGESPDNAMNLSNLDKHDSPEPYKIKEFVMDKKNALSMLLQAYSALENGDIDDAEDKVKTVLVFQPDNIEALSLLGKIYYLHHEYKKAEMIFRQQVRLNKNSASAYNNLGLVLLKQKKNLQATLQFEAAQKLDPNSGLIALNLSSAYSQQGMKKKSLASFEKAFELLGPKIITVVNYPALGNIRDEKEFKDILRKAYQELSNKEQAP